MSNVLIIPQYEEQIESLRRDLRKVITLQQKAAEINEATSAAILSLLDRVEMLALARRGGPDV